MQEVIGAAVVGYGFMGRTHAAAYRAIAVRNGGCVLRGVHTTRSGSESAALPATENSADEAITGIYASYDALLRDPSVHLVSICTPTDTHIELAVAALAAGKHVLLEKPVALSARAMMPLIETASRAHTLCMPAHCMRFWPGWPEARDIVQSGEYGAVKSAAFSRISPLPLWNSTFYLDTTRSGGPLFDLHIHDADYILWTFGQPFGLRTSGTPMHFQTEYAYDGFTARAEGAWSAAPDVAFQMKFRIEMEHAVLDFQHDRDTPLLLDRGAGAQPVDVGSSVAYENQILHMLDAIRSGARPLRVTLEDAHRVTELLAQESASLTR